MKQLWVVRLGVSVLLSLRSDCDLWCFVVHFGLFVAALLVACLLACWLHCCAVLCSLWQLLPVAVQ